MAVYTLDDALKTLQTLVRRPHIRHTHTRLQCLPCWKCSESAAHLTSMVCVPCALQDSNIPCDSRVACGHCRTSVIFASEERSI